MTVDELCAQRFGDYGHGLKLLGKPSFEITRDAAEKPKEHLDTLVKTFYNQS